LRFPNTQPGVYFSGKKSQNRTLALDRFAYDVSSSEFAFALMSISPVVVRLNVEGPIY
jgi:hypothetical protein